MDGEGRVCEEATGDFQVRADAVISHLRETIGGVIASIPGLTYCRPNDLAAGLGLSPKLAWCVGRCLEGRDNFAATQFIPGPAGMRTLLTAAKKMHAPDEVIERARIAFDEFGALVRKHAGARKHFNMLTASLAVTNRDQADTEHRRLLYDGSTYLWGMQARTIFRTDIIKPSAQSEMFDLATVRGVIDFTRVRTDASWRVRLPTSIDDAETVHTESPRRPLDPSVTGPVPLLADFCSQPLPRFRACSGKGKHREFECIDGSVGRMGQLTCVVGEYVAQIEPRYRQLLYQHLSLSFEIRTPARNLICDILVHRDMFADEEALRAELCSDLYSYGIAVKYDASDKLPLRETLEHLGTADNVAFTSAIPRYPEMLRYALRSVGWRADEFNFYRLRMQYPPIHTTLMFRRLLPEHLGETGHA